jgi:hypothetical protein
MSTTRHLAISFILVGAGCGGGGQQGDDVDGAPADASAACALATTYQDFTSIQENIFKRQCAFMDCHDSVSPESMMDLTAPNARDQLVDVDCRLGVAMAPVQLKRVIAGDPMNSYLMQIIGQYPGPLDPDIGTMPENSPLLCKEKRDAIERWITAGALDN